MKRLADDSIWQYVSALGRSGTKKLSMWEVMPNVMDIILLTAIKLLKVDPKEATTALSTYLKSTSYRAAARKEKTQNVAPVAVQEVDRCGSGRVERGDNSEDDSDDNDDYIVSPDEVSESE